LQPSHKHTTLLYAQGDASGAFESALNQGSAHTSQQIPSWPRWDYVRFLVLCCTSSNCHRRSRFYSVVMCIAATWCMGGCVVVWFVLLSLQGRISGLESGGSIFKGGCWDDFVIGSIWDLERSVEVGCGITW